MRTVKVIIWNLYHAICYFIVGGKDIIHMHACMHTQNNTHRQRCSYRQTDRHIHAHRHTDAPTLSHILSLSLSLTHTHTSRTKAITRNQACIGLWPTHTWLNACMILIKLLRYSHVTILVYEVANPLDNCNLPITYRKVFKNTQHAKINAERMNAKTNLA